MLLVVLMNNYLLHLEKYFLEYDLIESEEY